jgi:AbrB family looped-hinge helix DNA binding protein
MADITHRTRLSAGGRVVIPAEFRDKLGIVEGDPLDLVLVDDCVRIVPRKLVVARAKQRIRRAVGALASPSDDITAARATEGDDA